MKRERDEQVIKRVVYQTVCDNCGKAAEGADPDGWHHFYSYHSDWGNDSIESHEDWDACTFGCYLAIVRKVFDDYEGRGNYKSLEVDGKDWDFVRDMLSAQTAQETAHDTPKPAA